MGNIFPFLNCCLYFISSLPQETAAQEAALRRLRELQVLREREKVEAEAAVFKLSQEKDLLLAMTREVRGKSSW